MVGKGTGRELLDTLPSVFGVERERLRLAIAGFEIEDAVPEFSGSCLEGAHEEFGDAGAAKVGPDPQALHLTRREFGLANRPHPDATREMTVRTSDEIEAERWA